jgi:hypothetical protein
MLIIFISNSSYKKKRLVKEYIKEVFQLKTKFQFLLQLSNDGSSVGASLTVAAAEVSAAQDLTKSQA